MKGWRSSNFFEKGRKTAKKREKKERKRREEIAQDRVMEIGEGGERLNKTKRNFLKK